MTDPNWEFRPGSGPLPKTPEHTLVLHIYESLLVYALVSGFGLYAFFELWDQKLWVLCCVLPVFALCLWADLKKRKTLRAEITARLGAGLVSGEARPQLCAEALRVLGYYSYASKNNEDSEKTKWNS